MAAEVTAESVQALLIALEAKVDKEAHDSRAGASLLHAQVTEKIAKAKSELEREFTQFRRGAPPPPLPDATEDEEEMMILRSTRVHTGRTLEMSRAESSRRGKGS